MTTGVRKTHDFCFINLMTRDGEKARDFYAKLLGWTYGEMPGVPGGALILVGGKTAGAVMDLDRVAMPPGTPPVIGVMIKVEDADATVARIAKLGGHADPPVDALQNGRMAMCTDPNGATFGIWQPKKEHGFDVDSHAHGAPTWFETMTTDADRASTFYTSLFGWKADAQAMPGGATYTRFFLGNVPIGGAMTRLPHMGDVPPHWGVYFAVDDTDAIAKRAPELGGKVCLPPMDIPGVGRFALLQSPQGVAFHVMKYCR